MLILPGKRGYSIKENDGFSVYSSRWGLGTNSNVAKLDKFYLQDGLRTLVSTK
jgi:hypothetical protein